ncbi:nuclear transport factor 2 family protein [Parahaliea sp. F7430]|uniref:Nuclear transport factor 2 family protein n=1 Tax=Sediminihaliea albiluteola TaxID=2758564 RepID=A0A7W2YKK2_9GAMM|nr:nuclear transport factor 2 family protein [Sediminihaliea albiluteola]MBA6414187.1 nuclear transport factor 2 family protein [Sediminihaliea albiluteola]
MPTKDQVENAINEHFDAWNAMDQERWSANFSDDIVFEDPYGGPLKTGRDAVKHSWENSFKDGAVWKLEPLLTQICLDQAALVVRSTGSVKGKPVTLEGIEIYTVNDQGKVCHIRTYFNPPEGFELDPYFSQVSKD